MLSDVGLERNNEIMNRNFLLISQVVLAWLLCAVAFAQDPRVTATLAELNVLTDAEEQVQLDTTYYVSIENLNDLVAVSQEPAYEAIGDGGGTPVLSPSTGLFKAAREDLVSGNPLKHWQGPYLNFDSNRVDGPASSYDPGTPLDRWGTPYYLFGPHGLIRPPLGDRGPEFYGDQFDTFAIVSLGPDGTTSGDDLIRVFGPSPTALTLSQASPGSAQPGETVELRGYNFGNSQASSQVLLGTTPLSGIASWSDRTIHFTAPSQETTGTLTVKVGTAQSNGVPFEVILVLNASDWTLYQ